MVSIPSESKENPNSFTRFLALISMVVLLLLTGAFALKSMYGLRVKKSMKPTTADTVSMYVLLIKNINTFAPIYYASNNA